MSTSRWILKISLAGALTGALLAMTAPPSSASARGEEGCKCDDDGSGNYSCNAAQTACIAGNQVCDVKCAT